MENERKKVLWKYDDELGIAYFCPTCKLFVCGGDCECGQKLDYDLVEEYKGPVRWE